MTVLQPANREALMDLDLQRRSTQPGQAGEDAPADRKRARQAWLHEMERAQLSNWFQPFAANPLVNGAEAGHSQRSAALRPPETLSMAGQTALASRSGYFPMSSAATVREGFPRPVSEAPLDVAATLDAMAPQAIKGSQGDAPQSPAVVEHEDTAAELAGSASRNQLATKPAEQEPAQSPSAGNHAVAQGMVVAGSQSLGEIIAGAEGARVPQVVPSLPVNADPKVVNPSMGTSGVVSLSNPVAVFLRAPSGRVDQGSVAGESSLFSVELNAKSPLSDLPRAGDTARQPAQPGTSPASRLVGGSTAQQAATRLHANWTPDGLNLWIGMDGTAQQVTAQAAVVVNMLQRTLRNQGHRLSRVVCNGSVVYDAATASSGAPLFSDFASFLEQRTVGHFTPGLFSFPPPKENS
ncbi:hypothetical protein AVMA1855_24200 [Acidovorax sp. SUPP1855]|uniref:hypothetical protein n=1 Tax=Acidovorax sp. SUPP1855 TaxID=431774 RepID=UPI0023DE2332|nr:hypothetical protein [Acidovorax sp. SUPP1855]GKS87314.1 hypothetical protein AVMA1855_24200 [Acidovorax sp. SUPP1855]